MVIVCFVELFPTAGTGGDCQSTERGEEEKENSWNELRHRRESSMGALLSSGISGSVAALVWHFPILF